MTALPAIAGATGASVTEGDFKNFITNQRLFLEGLFGTSGDKGPSRVSMQVPLNSKTDKSGAYTVVAADAGKVINCTTGTWTLSVTSAATLGDGFVFGVMNIGAGTITIDPAGTETIDGATTKTLAPGRLLLVYCNGSSFASVGGVDSAAIASALGYTPANLANAGTDHTHDFSGSFVAKGMSALAVGMIAYCTYTNASSLASGSTTSGANLTIGGSVISSGTWKNIGPATINQNGEGMFQRTV